MALDFGNHKVESMMTTSNIDDQALQLMDKSFLANYERQPEMMIFVPSLSAPRGVDDSHWKNDQIVLSLHDRSPLKYEKIVSDLALLQSSSNHLMTTTTRTTSAKTFVIRAPPQMAVEDDDHKIIAAITSFFRHCNEIRGNKNHHDHDHKEWKSLTLETNADFALGILQEDSIANLFSELVLEIRDVPLSSEPWTQSFQHLFQQQQEEGAILDSLALRRCKLTPPSTKVLQELMESKCLQRLHFHRVEFTNPSLCAAHLEQGIKANSNLTFLEFSLMDSNQEVIVQVLEKALLGHSSLQELVLVPCWSNPESHPQLINSLSHVVAHEDCRMERLHLTCWNEHTLSGHDDEFCKNLTLNQSLREITIHGPIKHSTVQQLVQLASKSNRITKLAVDARIKDLSPYVNDNSKNDSNNHPISTLRSWNMDLIQVEQNREHILEMVTKQFPYLYQLSTLGPELTRLRTTTAEVKSGCTQADHDHDDGADMDEEQRRTIPSSSSLLTEEIGLWLERNQVGRALLLPSVEDTIPLGLWPSVLAKAANSTSVLVANPQPIGGKNDVDDRNDPAKSQQPPLDGLHYMMNGLLPYLLSGHR